LTFPVVLYNHMVIDTTAMDHAISDRLDATFLALADPTRRAILARLARGEASVTELAEPFAISQPAISKHLKILERAGLVSVGQDAQRRPRRLEGEPLAEASGWLERYRDIWEASFQRLDTVLEELQRRPSAPRRARTPTRR
jgi:DNA-binding transcriptional ArsR family regulator